METKRRDIRYVIRCTAELTFGRQTTSLSCEDVSYRGVFLRTDSPPGLRQLVRVALELPDGKKFSAHGMTVHVVEGNLDRMSGVGVQFYALDLKHREVWDTFVRDVSMTHPQSREQAPLRRPDPDSSPAAGDNSIRLKAILPVRVKTAAELLALYARDVATGGMFVPTEEELPPLSQVIVNLHHPHTDETFSLSGVVRHRQGSPSARGVGVELVHLNREMREDFLKFVQAGAPSRDDGIFIDEDDPLFL